MFELKIVDRRLMHFHNGTTLLFFEIAINRIARILISFKQSFTSPHMLTGNYHMYV
jgi:hypothetical protein